MKQSTVRLTELKERLKTYSETFIGYPINLAYDYTDLFDFFHFSINNVGDPFTDSLYKITTRELEREIIHFFSKLYKIPTEKSWGYVTTGGTEGNLYGLFLARELYPEGILYFSADSHYSIPKNARILNMRHVVVPSVENGEIDYRALEAVI